jgi:hypothetical protein
LNGNKKQYEKLTNKLKKCGFFFEKTVRQGNWRKESDTVQDYWNQTENMVIMWSMFLFLCADSQMAPTLR